MTLVNWSRLLLLVTVAGCESCHSHEHPHGDHAHSDQAEHADHEHADNAIGITRFSQKLELFAEHPPAVAGKPLPFLAHLTLLDGFSPLEHAKVTLVLEGPQKAEAHADKPLRPGIFRPSMTAPAPGSYKARLLVRGPKLQDTIEGFDIVVHATANAAEKAARSEESDGNEPITFLKEQQWQIPFATAWAKTGSLVPTLEVAGEITTPPSGQADVGAAITGRVVALAKGLPRPGQAVKKGELLATIAPAPAAPETGARAELAVVEAEARVQSARAALQRAERLIADRAIAQREVDEARRELRVAEEAVEAARRTKSIFSGAASGQGGGSYRVTAPISGVVIEVPATAGQSVTSGQLLLRLVNLDELWVRARVPEQQAARVRDDQDASFTLPGIDTWLKLDVTGEDANASVVHVGRTVDQRSRTIDVIYGLREADQRLRVGALVRVAVPVGNPWRGVVVARDAVLEEEGRALVYVQVEGEAFEERTVRLGPRAGALVGVERGLRADERVVTRGANVIRLSARASTAPAHGHVH